MLFLVFSSSAVRAEDDGATGATSKVKITSSVAVKDFVFEYRIDGGNLVGKLTYPTTGWVAVGFKPTKKMQGANIIIGSADGKESTVADHFGTGPVSHKPDDQIGGSNNLIEASCSESDGVTTMWFTIPLDSGDEKDVKLVKGETIKVIFAAGKKDGFGLKHVKTAGKEISL
jgi:hypothetical protein